MRSESRLICSDLYKQTSCDCVNASSLWHLHNLIVTHGLGRLCLCTDCNIQDSYNTRHIREDTTETNTQKQWYGKLTKNRRSEDPFKGFSSISTQTGWILIIRRGFESVVWGRSLVIWYDKTMSEVSPWCTWTDSWRQWPSAQRSPHGWWSKAERALRRRAEKLWAEQEEPDPDLWRTDRRPPSPKRWWCQEPWQEPELIQSPCVEITTVFDSNVKMLFCSYNLQHRNKTMIIWFTIGL